MQQRSQKEEDSFSRQEGSASAAKEKEEEPYLPLVETTAQKAIEKFGLKEEEILTLSPDVKKPSQTPERHSQNLNPSPALSRKPTWRVQELPPYQIPRGDRRRSRSSMLRKKNAALRTQSPSVLRSRSISPGSLKKQKTLPKGGNQLNQSILKKRSLGINSQISSTSNHSSTKKNQKLLRFSEN